LRESDDGLLARCIDGKTQNQTEPLNGTRKYIDAETLALLTKPLYFLNVKYLK
jgi:hypothetical protein